MSGKSYLSWARLFLSLVLAFIFVSCLFPPLTTPALVSRILVTGAGGVTQVLVGGTLQMNADVRPANANDRRVTWSAAEGTGRASISSSGLLSALSAGSVTVKASAMDGSNIVGTLGVDVLSVDIQPAVVPVQSIAIAGTGGATSIGAPGGKLQLVATVTPADATDPEVVWSLGTGSELARISAAGLLTALSDGTVTVKATAHDGSGVSATATFELSGQAHAIALTLGQDTHVWDTLLGGVIWMNSKGVAKQISDTLTELPGTVLVDLKASANGFGYRFDLDYWEPTEPSHGWFAWDGTDNQPPNLDGLFQIYGKPNVKFILSIPVPNNIPGPNQLLPPDAYDWQTPDFAGAECQYLFGAAGDPSEYQNLPAGLDFKTQPPSFNWANLRAARGHVAPYAVEAVILGTEPYYVDGWAHDGAAYGAMAELYRAAIRARGINVAYGICQDQSMAHNSGIIYDPAGNYFDHLMGALSASDPPVYYDLYHQYQYHIAPDWNRSFPVAQNEAGFTYWPRSTSTWDMDYSHFLFSVDDMRMALSQRGISTGKLGWSEHGITVTSQFEWNDMSGAIHWASWLSETMRLGTQWDSMWCLGGEGFATALVQVRGVVIRPPAFYVYRLAMGLSGMTYVDSSYTSPLGSTLWLPNDMTSTVQFPWLVIRVLRDPASGNLSLFVINQSTTDYYRITGLESRFILRWAEVAGSAYTDGDPFSSIESPSFTAGPIRTGDVAKAPDDPLIFPPVSITRVDLR